MQSDNYVTRRRSLKLLSELLLDRNNYTVMMKYISSKHHLKVRVRISVNLVVAICADLVLIFCCSQTIMNLLRHKSPQIQFE